MTTGLEVRTAKRFEPQRAEELTDYHCHLLPGLDDGATDLDAALEMARILATAGFRRIHCTPHAIHGVYDTPPQQVREATTRLQRALDRASIALELCAGMEYYLDAFFLDNLSEPLPLSGRLILVEIPSRTSEAEEVSALLAQTVNKGFTPLIAHPERCALLAPRDLPRQPEGWMERDEDRRGSGAFPDVSTPVRLNRLTAALAASGCRFQGNFGSFAGLYGEEVRRHAEIFLAAGLYSCFGSDAHHPERLAAYMRRGLRATGYRSATSTREDDA